MVEWYQTSSGFIRSRDTPDRTGMIYWGSQMETTRARIPSQNDKTLSPPTATTHHVAFSASRFFASLYTQYASTNGQSGKYELYHTRRPIRFAATLVSPAYVRVVCRGGHSRSKPIRPLFGRRTFARGRSGYLSPRPRDRPEVVQ